MPTPNSIRIAIASYQPIFLRGLSHSVRNIPGIQVVGEANSSTDLLQLCQLTLPDLVLIDLRAANDSQEDITIELSQRWPKMEIVRFIPCEDNQDEDNLSDYYITRDVSEEELKAALTQILNSPKKIKETNSHLFRHQEELLEEEANSEPLKNSPPYGRNEEVLRYELTMASRIQTDILPDAVPPLPNWDIASRLVAARETSGDFYDFIRLSNHKWGLVVADVTDKGMGAALFMALSSTLIRTYATQFPTLPGLTMKAVNERILYDTRGDMFVTAFYAVLESHTGRITYSNGGHPPAILVHTDRGRESVDRLRLTGMALGVSEEALWKQKTVRMWPGDVLVLYTDGITEAQNPNGDFFGEERLIDTILENSSKSSNEIQDALINAVNRFTDSPNPQDDIAMIVIRKKY